MCAALFAEVPGEWQAQLTLTLNKSLKTFFMASRDPPRAKAVVGGFLNNSIRTPKVYSSQDLGGPSPPHPSTYLPSCMNVMSHS